MSGKQARLITLALIAATLGLFAATGMLYLAQNAQRQLLGTALRTAGWAAYQAQLEYVRTAAALDLAATDPSRAMLDEVMLRLEALNSRLPILHASQDRENLPGMAQFTPRLTAYEERIQSWLDRLQAGLTADAASPLLADWRQELAPLRGDLQELLELSLASEEAALARDGELAGNVATLPLVLMFLCGGGLFVLLGVQARHFRRRLDDMLEAQEAQRASETSFRAVIESMPTIIVIYDPATRRLSFVNHAAADLVDADTKHPGWQHLISAAIGNARTVPGDSAVAMNIAFARPNGEFSSLRGSAYDVMWEGRRQRLLALADNTKIRDAELQVMQAAKLATLGEMATAIAHEANQPLAVIRMAVANAKRLYEKGEVGEALSAKLTRIADQVERVKRITDQVRRYGRLGSRLQEPFAVKESISLAVSFVAEQYRAAGIHLEVDVDLPVELSVCGEQTMFEQVIVNLLVNARDACESGGGTDPAVSVRSLVRGDCVEISIEDNAGGIPAHMMQRIFEPFATTKPAGKGTGLGLSVSRNIVRDMNGDISAQNIRAGARFTVTLPLALAQIDIGEAA
ncbi:sensor histidine kinase [Afifella pfennigii]|uniref:sensor histidine kinase n=1 Tax=Afifella pfennigii TaxID=209897 RepID=UPI00068D24FB|nr:ATP-binding protein [Afifella pfennigii]